MRRFTIRIAVALVLLVLLAPSCGPRTNWYREGLKKLDRQERHEYLAWGDLSLRQALRGMEDEPTPGYSIADLNVVFK